MAQSGITVSAQEGLTWDRWRRVVADTERLGFASLRVADHLQSVTAVPCEGLPAWSALHLAAEWTKHIELAPQVSPVTFYQPGVLLREAEAVDQLSGGRLLLGLGAGWNAAEHERFDVPFHGWTYRFNRLEHTIELMHRLWRELPGARPLPLLMGGTGARRALPLIARYAREWNGPSQLDPAAYRATLTLLEEACAAVGRNACTIRHSLQTWFLIGRGEEDLRERAVQMMDILNAEENTPDEFIEALKLEGAAVGTPDEFVEHLRPFVEAGVELFMFEHLLQLDSVGLELLATEVMPRLA